MTNSFTHSISYDKTLRENVLMQDDIQISAQNDNITSAHLPKSEGDVIASRSAHSKLTTEALSFGNGEDTFSQ
jgi:hypothetical protein